MDYRLNYAFLGDLVALEGTFNEKELKEKSTHLLRRKNWRKNQRKKKKKLVSYAMRSSKFQNASGILKNFKNISPQFLGDMSTTPSV